MISGNKNEQIWGKLDRDIVWESKAVELFGISLGNNLKFDKNMCQIFDKMLTEN